MKILGNNKANITSKMIFCNQYYLPVVKSIWILLASRVPTGKQKNEKYENNRKQY